MTALGYNVRTAVQALDKKADGSGGRSMGTRINGKIGIILVNIMGM